MRFVNEFNSTIHAAGAFLSDNQPASTDSFDMLISGLKRTKRLLVLGGISGGFISAHARSKPGSSPTRGSPPKQNGDRFVMTRPA